MSFAFPRTRFTLLAFFLTLHVTFISYFFRIFPLFPAKCLGRPLENCSARSFQPFFCDFRLSIFFAFYRSSLVLARRWSLIESVFWRRYIPKFCTSRLDRGLYFGPKTFFLSPPPSKNSFSPSRDTLFFDSHRGLLILPCFAFILPLYFPFSHFLSPFFLFHSPFFLFLLHFPPFSLHLFIFFPPNNIGWYSPGVGGGIFQYKDPCV